MKITKRQILDMARSVRNEQGYNYYCDLVLYPDGEWYMTKPNTGVRFPDVEASGARVLQIPPLDPEDKKRSLSECLEEVERFVDDLPTTATSVE